MVAGGRGVGGSEEDYDVFFGFVMEGGGGEGGSGGMDWKRGRR